MPSNRKVALVTGSNKGLGYAIVKGLCESYEGDIIMTSRDMKRGQEAVAKLNKLGFHPKLHQLDILDKKSILSLAQIVEQQYGGLDLLVNNAAIAFHHDSVEPFDYQAEVSIRTNYTALVDVCEALFPLLRKNARVVNMSSALGHLSKIRSQELKNKLNDPNLSVAKLSDLMQSYVSSAKANRCSEDGWGETAYINSKVGVSTLTIVQQRDFDREVPPRNVSVNSVHPGYVDTDMTNHKGPLTVEQGARAPLYLCLENHGLRGQFVWKDCTVVDWFAADTPEFV